MSPKSIPLSQAIAEWDSHSAATAMALSTKQARTRYTTLLIRVNGDMSMLSLNAKHVERVFNSVAWAANTHNQALSMLRRFFAWARNRRYMTSDQDPLFGWRNRRVPRAVRQRIPMDEWPILFDACAYPTETILIGLGLFMFLRGSEIQSLRVRDVNLDAGYILIHRIKTAEWDEMPISVEFDAILREYLTWYAAHLAENGIALAPDHYLVPPRCVGSLRRDPRTGRVMAGSGRVDPTRCHSAPYTVVQRVLDLAGYSIEGAEGVHTLRRSGARAYYDSLADSGIDRATRRVMMCLGHKSTGTTEVYLGMEADRAERDRSIKGKLMFGGKFRRTSHDNLPSNVTPLRVKEG